MSFGLFWTFQKSLTARSLRNPTLREPSRPVLPSQTHLKRGARYIYTRARQPHPLSSPFLPASPTPLRQHVRTMSDDGQRTPVENDPELAAEEVELEFDDPELYHDIAHNHEHASEAHQLLRSYIGQKHQEQEETV